MSGTKAGGAKARATMYKNHGKDYYKRIGALGGKHCGMKGFALNPELARKAGEKGGRTSKRGNAKKEVE